MSTGHTAHTRGSRRAPWHRWAKVDNTLAGKHKQKEVLDPKHYYP